MNIEVAVKLILARILPTPVTDSKWGVDKSYVQDVNVELD